MLNLKSDTEFIEKSEVSGFVIERTAKRMKQYFQRLLKENDTGVTVDQWVILQELEASDGCSQYELAQKTYKDAPTVTRIIDLLEAKELIERWSDPDDRRKFKILLTKKGREKIEEVNPYVQSFRRAGWSGLSDQELNQLVKTLNIIYTNLD